MPSDSAKLARPGRLSGHRLSAVEDRAEHDHRAVRQGVPGHAHQRGGTGVHQDRPERRHRPPERRPGSPDHRAHDANRLPASQTRRPGPLLTVPVPGRITWIVPGRNGADMSALTTRPRVMEAAKAGLAAVTALGICLVTSCGSSGRPNPLTGTGTAGRLLAGKTANARAPQARPRAPTRPRGGHGDDAEG